MSRSSLEGLEAREEVPELPQEQQKCPRCGRPLDRFRGQTRPRWWRSRPESGVG